MWQRLRGDRGRGRREALGAQGRERARRDAADLRVDRKGQEGRAVWRQNGSGLDGSLVRAKGRRHRGTPRPSRGDGGRQRRGEDYGENRKTQRRGRPGAHLGGSRRGDGGAGRLGRGALAAQGAHRAEAHRIAHASHRQARCRRYSDARVDDQAAHAHARRGQRRSKRDLRRGRRGDAQRGVGRGRLPDGVRRDDGGDHQRSGGEPRVR
mmetsp:Transcript_20750/g.36934  ORF Transcript_20750/g.36934 Transcript_20750/m.36934 type:complete len:209 (+) Transcript_20750:619-1245(+)